MLREPAGGCAGPGTGTAETRNAAPGPTTLLLPLGGVSMLDREGQPFHDPAADEALFSALREHVGSGVTLVELDRHINDPEFATAMAEKLDEHYQAWASANVER